MSFHLVNSFVFSRSVSLPSPLPVRRRQKRNGTRRGDEGEGEEEEEEEPRQAISNSGWKKEGEEEEEESFGMTQNGGKRAREGANEYALAYVHPAAEKERKEMRNGGWDTLPLPPCVYSFSLSIFASRRSRINVSLRSSSFLPPSTPMLHPSKKKRNKKEERSGSGDERGVEGEFFPFCRGRRTAKWGGGGGGKGNREVEEGLRIPIPLSLLFFTFIPLSSMGLAFFLMHLQGSFCLAKKQFLCIFFYVLETYQSCTRARSPNTTAQHNIAPGLYTKAAPLHQREGCSLGSSTPEKRRRRKKWRLISISRCLLAPLLSFYEGVGIDGRRGGGGKAEDGSLGPLRLCACLPLPLAGLVWFEREYDTEGLHSFQFYFRLSQKESY